MICVKKRYTAKMKETAHLNSWELSCTASQQVINCFDLNNYTRLLSVGKKGANTNDSVCVSGLSDYAL